MNKTIRLGKVKKSINGYTIREIVKEGKNPKGKMVMLSTGKFGLYAGKKLIEEFIANSQGMEDAIITANILSEKIKKENKKRTRYLTKDTPIKTIHETAKGKESGKAAYLKRINK